MHEIVIYLRTYRQELKPTFSSCQLDQFNIHSIVDRSRYFQNVSAEFLIIQFLIKDEDVTEREKNLLVESSVIEKLEK